MKNRTIVLTGGGTAGHVSLNQAIIPELMKKQLNVAYIGSKEGIEKELIEGAYDAVPYHAISSGKLRRYASMKNFTDPFRVGRGFFQARKILKKTKPVAVFSKGGFVSVPVVMAARTLKLPVVIHESDVTPGLANKLALPFASQIFTVFKETLKYVPADKSTCTGAVIRTELLQGSEEHARELCNFQEDLPVLLVMGGSQGSVIINTAIRDNLATLTERFNVIHLTGKGNSEPSLIDHPRYRQFEYVTDELTHLLHFSDFIVSRAGSNSIFEFLALKKPMLLVPLSKLQSRGDQLLNADLFKRQGFAHVLEEEELTPERFMTAIGNLQAEEDILVENMSNAEMPKTAEKMTELILQYANL